MAGELHSLTGVGHLIALDLEDRQIAVGEVADVHVLPVGTKHDPLGQAAYFDLADLGYLLAVDLQRYKRARGAIVEGLLVAARAAQQDRHREIALRADCEALRRVTNDDMVDHPRRVSARDR